MKSTELQLFQPSISLEFKLATLLSRPTLTIEQRESASKLIQAVDIAIFQEVVEHHRIWSCVYLNISEHFPSAFPNEFIEGLDKKHQQSVLQCHLQFKAHAELLHLFKTASIPAQLIKGLPLAQKLYGDTAKRHSKDIDLVIPAEHISQANEKLASIGFQCNELKNLSETQRSLYLGYHKDFQYVNATGVSLELHVRLADHTSKLSNHLTQQLFISDTLENKQVEEFVYLCWHGTQSLYHRLKWLLDIALYIENRPIDDPQFIENVIELATKIDALRSVTVSWVLANTLYGTQLPDEILRLYEGDRITRIITHRAIYALNNPDYINSIRCKIEWNACGILLPQQWSEKWVFLERRFKPNGLDILMFPNIPDRFSKLYYLLRPVSLLYRKTFGRR